MTRGVKGRAIIERLPLDRVLTETDGPHVSVEGRAVRPGEVEVVLTLLASEWNMTTEEAETQVYNNLRSLVAIALHKKIGLHSGDQG
jgi:TatD DNase family protein